MQQLANHKRLEKYPSQALAFDLPHLSLYQLTIETGTVFYTRQRNGETLHLDDDHAADLFQLTQNDGGWLASL